MQSLTQCSEQVYKETQAIAARQHHEMVGQFVLDISEAPKSSANTSDLPDSRNNVQTRELLKARLNVLMARQQNLRAQQKLLVELPLAEGILRIASEE